MTKIEALSKKYELAKAAAVEEREIIKAKEAELETLKQKEAEAATAGDIAAYTSTKAKRTALEDEIFVRKSSDPVATTIKQNDVLAAWKESTTEYRKAIASIEKDVEKATKDLLSSYRKIVNAQIKMLRDREMCAEMAGIKADDTDYADRYRNQLPVDFVELKARQNIRLQRCPRILAEYLAEAGVLKDDDIAFDNMIFGAHRLN